MIYLSVPHRVSGVGYDGASSLLAVVGERREAVSLAWLDTHLQIGVRIKKHALLQTLSPDICNVHIYYYPSVS